MGRLLFRLYRLSGLAFPYRRYLALLAAAPPAAGAAAALAAVLLTGSPAGAALGAAVGLVAFAGLLLYPIHLVSARRSHFESGLVYTLATALPMLAAGIPLQRVLERLAEVEADPFIRRELALVVRDMAAGVPPMEALRRSAERVPSPSYRELVWLMEGAAATTGRLDAFLASRLDWMLRVRRARAAALVRSLSLLFEAYIVATLLLPMLLYILAIALSPLGALAIGGISLDPTAVMLLGAIFSALVGVVFYVAFDSMLKL